MKRVKYGYSYTSTSVHENQVKSRATIQQCTQDKLKWFAKSDKTGTDLVRRSVTVIMLLQTFQWTCISTFASTPNKSYTGQLSAPGNKRFSIT